ncbi:MAG: phosphatidylglycerol lysyltransferase domain-containing protein, partial [Actinobacteria bacterium]|nr:phosphatidylglycerol lysyltransferase domain-containing protein [Actinomycetota bacterium]
YQAYADYTDMMELVQHVVVEAALASLGSTTVWIPSGQQVDLALPWRRASMSDLVFEHTGERIDARMELGQARAALGRLGLGFNEVWGSGRCLVAVFEDRVEANLISPTIVTGHPVETSPLARHCRTDPSLTERFEVIVGGMELANAYSELNDPVEQRERFMSERSRAQAAGEDTLLSSSLDQRYVEALERGLPPTGGLGIGIDRLVMLLTNSSSIRDVILFPTMRSPHTDTRAATGRSDLVPTAPLPTATAPGAQVAAVRLSGLVRVVAMLTSLVGVLTMLSAVPAISARTLLLDELISPLPLVLDTAVLSVGFGSCMVLLSGQLLRGKRRAWNLALVLFVLSAGFSVARGGEGVALTASLTMIVILLLTRSEFTGLADPPSLLRVARSIPRFLLLVYLYGFLALWAQQGTLSPSMNLSDSSWAITVGLVGGEQPYEYSGRFARLFPASLEVLGALGLLLLLWLLLRPAVRGRVGEGRERAAAMVEQLGWDTLAPFACRDDKSYFFSSDGLAMVAYGYLGGFALVSGDPIGEDASIPLVVDEFILHCQHHGWQPAFLAAREVDVPLYAERGFRSFYLGDEA